MRLSNTLFGISFFIGTFRQGLAILFLIAGTFLLSSAYADDTATDAEAFMSGVLNKANRAMAENNPDRQLAEIDELVRQYGDLRRTGRFTLGQYARQMTREQAAQFYPLFQQYATNIYHEILANYTGERLAVSNAIVRSQRDVIINSKIVASNTSSLEGAVVQWRLYRTPDGFKVVDAGADNIWLAIEQRSQFTSIIANNGGGTKGITALINQLRERLE